MVKIYLYCLDCGENSDIEVAKGAFEVIPEGTKCPFCHSTNLTED